MIFSKSEWGIKLNELGVPLGDALRFIDDITDAIKESHSSGLVALDEDEVFEFSIKFWKTLANKVRNTDNPPVKFLTNLCELICQRFGTPKPVEITEEEINGLLHDLGLFGDSPPQASCDVLRKRLAKAICDKMAGKKI